MHNKEYKSTPMFTNFTLTHQLGGMIAFEKTGILPEFLIFNSKNLKRTWRVKLKEDKQNGVLRMNGTTAFTYFFDGLGCKIQSIVAGVATEEWQIEKIVMELRD